MHTFHLPDDITHGLEKWAEYFQLPVEETLHTILRTALADLQAGSPMFFEALDPTEEQPLPFLPEEEEEK